MKTTLYQLLGVDPNAAIDAIEAACARGVEAADARGDSAASALLKQAREVLTDPLRRNAYDASIAAAASGTPSTLGRRSARNESTVSTGTLISVVAVVAALVAALVGASVWTLARREAPRPLSAPAVPGIAKGEPAKAASAEAAAPSAVESPRTPAPSTGSAPSPSSAASTAPAAPVVIRPAALPAPTPVRPPEQPTSVPLRTGDAGSIPVRAADAAGPASPSRSAENVYADVAASVARVTVADATDRLVGSGSGVVIEPGVVLTNCHVVKNGPKLSVKVGEFALPATLLLADEEFDLCRLAVAGLRAPAVRVGSVTSLRTGQKVYAIGAPAGLELTISEGIVSSLRRIQEGTVIQTTAPISPGSSGGGLFDLSGQLVGIMTFQHRFGQNLNFALPADWIAQMRERGLGTSGWRAATVAASTGDKSAGLIVGQWLCRDWISGRAGSFRFDPDGRVNIAMSEVPAVVLNYGMSGKALVVFDQNKGAALTINELTAKKMILKGTDRSIACER